VITLASGVFTVALVPVAVVACQTTGVGCPVGVVMVSASFAGTIYLGKATIEIFSHEFIEWTP